MYVDCTCLKGIFPPQIFNYLRKRGCGSSPKGILSHTKSTMFSPVKRGCSSNGKYSHTKSVQFLRNRGCSRRTQAKPSYPLFSFEVAVQRQLLHPTLHVVLNVELTVMLVKCAPAVAAFPVQPLAEYHPHACATVERLACVIFVFLSTRAVRVVNVLRRGYFSLWWDLNAT